MQNVANYLCPFFGIDGNPIVNGRVYFLKPDTSAQTFQSLTNLDAGDYITIKDKNGTPLENPLPLNSLGQFSTQPFADDGIDFKMVVCYPTGIPANLDDETPSWDIAYTMLSKAQHVSITYDGIKTVGGLPELRETDPGLGTVLVTGYFADGDFCPPRIFTWKTAVNTDNGGTYVRSSVQGHSSDGTWILAPSGHVDIRWFGVDPSTETDCTATLGTISADHPNIPVYLPAGHYNLSSSITINSVILDRLAIVRPSAETTSNIYVTIGALDNRGGVFGVNSLDRMAIPKVNGTLYMSWLPSSFDIDAVFADAVLAKVDTLVFDSDISVANTVTVTGKNVIVMKDVVPDLDIKFRDCIVYDENGGKIYGIGDGFSVVPYGSGSNPRGLYVKNGDDILAEISKDGTIKFNGLMQESIGFEIGNDHKNLFSSYTANDATDDWDGLLRLLAERAKIESLRAYASNIEVASVAHLDVGSAGTALRKGGFFLVDANEIKKYDLENKTWTTVRAVSNSVASFVDDDFAGGVYWNILCRVALTDITLSLPDASTLGDTALVIAVHGEGSVTLFGTNSNFDEFGTAMTVFKAYSRVGVRHYAQAESVPYSSSTGWHVDPFFV